MFSYNNRDIILNIPFYSNALGANIVIEGENGSGKTTLGKLIAGIYKPSQGSIIINNIDISKTRVYERIMHSYYLAQINYLQFFCKSISEEISFHENIIGRKMSIDNYERYFLPMDRSINPLDLGVNEAWRFTMYLANIINPTLLFVDEMPSYINSYNMQVLKMIMTERKSNRNITMIAGQRSNAILCDAILKLRNGTIS